MTWGFWSFTMYPTKSTVYIYILYTYIYTHYTYIYTYTVYIYIYVCVFCRGINNHQGTVTQAAQCWQGAYYLGFDQDRQQLDTAMDRLGNLEEKPWILPSKPMGFPILWRICSHHGVTKSWWFMTGWFWVPHGLKTSILYRELLSFGCFGSNRLTTTRVEFVDIGGFLRIRRGKLSPVVVEPALWRDHLCRVLQKGEFVWLMNRACSQKSPEKLVCCGLYPLAI